MVLVLINSQGSSTFANSLMAKDLFFEEYPEYEGKIHFYNYDGMGYSAQYGQPVIEAAKMVKEGKALKEIHDFAKERNLSVAIPYKIGCCRAGGDWNIVFDIINEIFYDSVPMEIYKYEE